MSFRSKLTLSFLLVGLVGAGATGTALIASSYRAQLDQIAQKELLVAQNRAHLLQDDLQSVTHELTRLSSMAEVDLADGNMEPEKRVLRYARKDSRYFHMQILLLDSTGTCLWEEPTERGLLGVSLGGTPWFRELSRRLRPVLDDSASAPEASAPSDSRPLRIAVPILRKESFAGALVGVLEASGQALFREALHVELVKSGSVSLLDRSGRILGAAGATAGLEAAPLGPLWEDATHGTPGRAWLTDSDGRTWLYVYAPVVAAGWTLLIRQPRDELNNDLNRQLRVFLALLLAGLLFAGLLGAALARQVVRPLQRLSQRAQSIGRGEFGAMPPPTRTDEFGALEAALYRMDQAISARDREIREFAATLEAKVQARTLELRRTQEQLLLSSRFAAMGKTAAAIAHELKNALNGLGVAVDLLASGQASPERVAAVRRQVREEVDRLRDISDNLNLFGGAPRLVLSPSDLNELLRRTADLLGPLLREGQVEVQLELDAGGAPLTVPCDPQKLQSALINLCRNAVQAMAPAAFGEGLDEAPVARTRQLTLRTWVAAGVANIEVQDTGAGLSPAVQARLFEPFFTTKRTGTGLGLAIAHKVVEAHGGKLTASSPPEGGTLFRIELPRSEVEPHAGAPTPIPAHLGLR
jgi:signal transduction histidine kinase